MDASYRLCLALVGNSGLTAEGYEAARNSARDLHDALVSVHRPWEAAGDGGDELAALRDLYFELVGDPASPEFREREAGALRRYEEERDAQARRESDMAALRERLAARGRRR